MRRYEWVCELFDKEIDKQKSFELKFLVFDTFAKFMIKNNIEDGSTCKLETKIIGLYAKELKNDNLDICNPESSDKILHIVTTPYLTGGHTRLMENLSQMERIPSDLLVVKLGEEEPVLKRLKEYFDEIKLIKQTSALERLKMIVKFCKSYKTIILHIHRDDVETIVALGALKPLNNVRVIFVNHADHVMSFGYSISDIRLQISRYGFDRDNVFFPENKSSFIGIPLNINASPIKKVDLNKPFTIVTSGAPGKYKPQKGMSFISIAKYLLVRYPLCNLIAIGPNFKTNYWWWWLKFIYPTRLKVVKSLDYDSYTTVMNKTDVFLDSYPMPGGTAFVEQYLNGKNCIGLTAPLQGYTPAEILKNIDVSELNIIGNMHKSKKIECEISKVHGFDNVKSRYVDVLYNFHTHAIPDSLTHDCNVELDFYTETKIKTIDINTLRMVLTNRKFIFKFLNSISLYDILFEFIKSSIKRVKF